MLTVKAQKANKKVGSEKADNANKHVASENEDAQSAKKVKKFFLPPIDDQLF